MYHDEIRATNALHMRAERQAFKLRDEKQTSTRRDVNHIHASKISEQTPHSFSGWLQVCRQVSVKKKNKNFARCCTLNLCTYSVHSVHAENPIEPRAEIAGRWTYLDIQIRTVLHLCCFIQKSRIVWSITRGDIWCILRGKSSCIYGTRHQLVYFLELLVILR